MLSLRNSAPSRPRSLIASPLPEPEQGARLREGLGIDLVDVLGARGTSREPRDIGRHLQAADRSVVTRSANELCGDGITCQLVAVRHPRETAASFSLFFTVRGRIDTRISRGAEAFDLFFVQLRGVLPVTARISGEQRQDDSILIGGTTRCRPCAGRRLCAFSPRNQAQHRPNLEQST